jgi:hypothetical protein
MPETDGQRARLEACGVALFGPQWQRPLAAALKVDDRLVRRWFAEERPVPEDRWADIAALMRARGERLLEAAAALEVFETGAGGSVP